MADTNSKNIRYPSQLGIFLGLTGGGLIIGSIISILIWTMMTHRSVFTIETDMMKPEYYSGIMVMQVVSTFFMFFVPAYFFALICYRRPYQYLGYNFNFRAKHILLIIGILILTFPLSGSLATLNNILPIPKDWAAKFKAMEAAREAQEAALIQITTFSKYLISLVVIALLPAIFEETFFRGVMQNFLIRWFKGPWIAIILTSIIFSAIHMSYYGFLVRFALGFVLGLIFYYTGSIWLNILFHFLFNGIQVTVLYVMNMHGVKDTKALDSGFPLWVGAIALALIIYLFRNLKRTSNINSDNFIDATPEDEFDNWIANETN